MLTIGSTDLCEGREVKLIKAVDIQRILLLSVSFELCTPEGETVSKEADPGVESPNQVFGVFTTAVHWMSGGRSISCWDFDALHPPGPVGGERTG